MGVWIETQMHLNYAQAKNVTPFVGVWIETIAGGLFGKKGSGHTLRGCVD